MHDTAVIGACGRRGHQPKRQPLKNFRGDTVEASRKTSEKSKVVTENKPGLNEPTTTTVDNLTRKIEQKETARCENNDFRMTARITIIAAREQTSEEPFKSKSDRRKSEQRPILRLKLFCWLRWRGVENNYGD